MCASDYAILKYVLACIIAIGTGNNMQDRSGSSRGWEARSLDIAAHAGLGIRFSRVLTDNGSPYVSRRFKSLCCRLGLKHRRIRPYTPRTSGKAERFIQTVLREWAYAYSYTSSEERAQYLVPWIQQYNWHRPHASLNYHPPISRSGLSVNNLVALHS